MEGRRFIGRRLLRRLESERIPRSGLTLCLSALLVLTPTGKAEAATGGSLPEEPLSVLVSVSPERPSIDVALVVTLLVEYPDPSRVAVRAPALPMGVTLERVRSEPRLIRGDDREERWTVVEFTFSVAAEGVFAFEPFRVDVPEKQGRTPPLSIRVSGPGGAFRTPILPRSLEWERVPFSLRAGESAEILLVITGGGPVGDATIAAEAPEGALMESLPLTDEDRGRGVVGRFRLTALEPPGFRLPVVLVSFAGESALRAEAGRIAVSPGPAQESSGRRPAAVFAPAQAESGKRAMKPTFPNAPRLFAPLRPYAERALALARSAWGTDDYARSLALLRRAERDSVAGLVLGRVRKEAERSLGLTNTPDEDYAPTALAGLAIACLSALLLVLFFKRRVASGKRRGYTVAILFLALAALSLGRWAAVRLDAAGFFGRGIAAVAPACAVYRIPEKEGGVAAEFVAGQPVRLRSSAGIWQYAETADGQAGWVEAERMIRY